MSSFIKLSFGLILLLWASGSEAVAARQDCKDEALQAFREGVAAFEDQDWPLAISLLKLAAGYDCSAEKTWLPLYGRWRYPFEPQTYLGVALNQQANCLTGCNRHCASVDQESPPPAPAADPACSTADWNAEQLRTFEKSSVERSGDCWKGRCAELSDTVSRAWSTELTCPAVDLFAQLRQSGFPVEFGLARTGIDCEDVTTPGVGLWLALRSAKGENQLICEEMLEEFDSVVRLCLKEQP